MKYFLTILVAVSSMPLLAQWPSYPTRGVPRTADGKPNLSAPAPRGADGKPDFSGLWDTQNRGLSQFINIVPSVQGGLPYRPGMAEFARKRAEPPRDTEPITRCLPTGILVYHTWPGGYKRIVQTPGITFLLYEYNFSFRQIFTDGRPLPTDAVPTWNGYSTGRWEGDTLVVETSGFQDGQWLDTEGAVVTDAAKITERFRRRDFGHLEIQVTVDDPKAYTKPFTVTVNQVLKPDTDMMEYICLENEKDLTHLTAGTPK